MWEEVVEVIFEMMNGGAVVAAHLAVLEGVLGDSLEARLEGPGDALEVQVVDLVVPREALEALEVLAGRRVVPDRRTGS